MDKSSLPALILASGSSYRAELLARLRVPFEVEVPRIDESAPLGEAARVTAVRLARAKAEAVARRRPGALVIGSDQIAELDSETIGKPGTRDVARHQLRLQSGRTVLYHTGVCVIDGRSNWSDADVVTVPVRFRVLSDAAIDSYLDAEQPYDCAGSAKCEGLGIALVEAIESNDPSALIGLPLIRLVTMLRAAGFPILAD